MNGFSASTSHLFYYLGFIVVIGAVITIYTRWVGKLGGLGGFAIVLLIVPSIEFLRQGPGGVLQWVDVATSAVAVLLLGLGLRPAYGVSVRLSESNERLNLMSKLMMQLTRQGLMLASAVMFTSTLVVFVPAVMAGGHRNDGPVRAAGDLDGVSGSKYQYQIDPQGGGGDGDGVSGNPYVYQIVSLGGGGDRVDRSTWGTLGSALTIRVQLRFLWDSLLPAATIVARR